MTIVHTNNYNLCVNCWYNYNCLPESEYNGTPEDLLDMSYFISSLGFSGCKMNYNQRFIRKTKKINLR